MARMGELRGTHRASVHCTRRNICDRLEQHVRRCISENPKPSTLNPKLQQRMLLLPDLKAVVAQHPTCYRSPALHSSTWKMSHAPLHFESNLCEQVGNQQHNKITFM